MRNLTPANGTEVATYPLNPSAGFFDAVMQEGHQFVEALQAQVLAPAVPLENAEKLDNVPSFSPSFAPAPPKPRR